MIKTFFQKKKRLPLFLVPKVRKRHALPIYKDHETQWKLFAEGALRNQVFHDEVMHRGNKCLACDQLLTTGKTKYPHTEKHHHCYLWLYTGNARMIILSILKAASKKSFPLHGKCHGHIHEVEKYRFDKLAEKLQRDFAYPASSTNECV